MRSAIVSAIVAAIVAAPLGYSLPDRAETERAQDFAIRALTLCARNGKGYGIGRRQFVSHPMFAQCIDDYYDAHARAEGVDH